VSFPASVRVETSEADPVGPNADGGLVDPYPAEPGSSPSPVRRSVLGVPVDACSIDSAVREIERWVDERRGGAALYINAHLYNLIWDDPALAEVFDDCSLVYADGMSVVWAARMLGHEVPERVPLTYAIEDLAANWDRRGFSVYFLGGDPGRAETAAARLTERYPGIQVAGCHHGYFDDAESPAIIDDINAAKPDILLVGLGNPRQETWVAGNITRLDVAATMTCGGLFDWVSGLRRPAPRWVGRLGMEWMYRLLIEPRRLFARYLVGNPRFLWALGRAVVRGERAAAIPLQRRSEPELVIDLRDQAAAERIDLPDPRSDGETSVAVIDLTDSALRVGER
jgi:N-acetylglucosaminyldiphosphoundecaprenol N-acetyl-beta-D-mannosaminyltransferase